MIYNKARDRYRIIENSKYKYKSKSYTPMFMAEVIMYNNKYSVWYYSVVPTTNGIANKSKHVSTQ